MNYDCLTDEELARYVGVAIYQAECQDSCVSIRTAKALLERFIVNHERNVCAMEILSGERDE